MSGQDQQYGEEQYKGHGVKAALASLVCPGLGQLQSGHHLRGVAMIASFACSLTILCLDLWRGQGMTLPGKIALLLAPLVIWVFGVIEAYYGAIDQRKRDARRYDFQIMTYVRSYDPKNHQFEEIAVTKNVSRFGACLIMTREPGRGNPLTLDFQNQSKVPAHVVWTRETANRNEHLVGVRLKKPLRQL